MGLSNHDILLVNLMNLTHQLSCFATMAFASEGTWNAATAAAGCVLEGVERALDGRNARSFSAVRPPGHHALRAQALK